MSLSESVCVHAWLFCSFPYAPPNDRNMNQWSLFIPENVLIRLLSADTQLISLPDDVYFVLATEKHVFGIKWADFCTQKQDVCIRGPATFVEDTLTRGQIIFGIAMTTTFTAVAETKCKAAPEGYKLTRDHYSCSHLK